jgi:hypothetical protein
MRRSPDSTTVGEMKLTEAAGTATVSWMLRSGPKSCVNKGDG